jgi:hypothetical protein
MICLSQSPISTYFEVRKHFHFAENIFWTDFFLFKLSTNGEDFSDVSNNYLRAVFWNYFE